VRSLDWQLDAITICDDGATEVALSLDVAAGLHASWPYAAKLVVTHRIGTALASAFSIESRDSRPFHFSTALHTYFSVSAIDAVRIDGFDSTSYIDALDDWKLKRQTGAIAIDREVDRIYLATPARSIIRDTGWQREIVVDALGSHSAVVWNPWIEKSKRLSDFAPDAYEDMLCIETANVMDDAVLLAPGGKHVVGVTVASRSLP
jgi:glucose-6-phosphate 1-epimerase